ncbi:MAG: hypothetical protein KF830_07690 [Planctomycetes bacterium]|nr:hypothetical protein [Planctomycetota bacterium]
MVDADWEPLPEAERGLHPGELGPAATPRPTPGLVRPPAAAPPDAEALRAWQQLQQRVAAAPRSTSLVAAASHRARRQAARAAPASAGGPAATASPRGATGDGPQGVPAPVPSGPPDGAAVDGRDPREDQDWFRALPPAEQQRLRAVWAAQRARGEGSAASQRRLARRRAIAALAVALAVVVLGTGAAWPATLAAGALTAVLWARLGADRLRDPIVAVGALGVCHLALRFAFGPPGGTLFLDAILMVAFAALVGFDGEMRRSGGFDATNAG